jgi:hypothetical protein
VPDLIIAFGVDPGKIIADRGYSIEQWSKPPDFVLEIASESTAENDVTGKRDDYAAFGIPEYWRFDPSGGSYYGAPLSGDRLTSSGYQPIEIVRVDEAHHRGHSPVLGMDLCWEEEKLRWYDPASLQYLLTFDETEEARVSAERELDAAEERVRELEDEIRRLRD